MPNTQNMQGLSIVYNRNKYLAKSCKHHLWKQSLKPEVVLSCLFQEISLAHWETTFCSKVVHFFFTFRKRCYLLTFLFFWQTFSSASGLTEGKCSYTNCLWLTIKEQEKFCFQCKWGNLCLHALGNSDFPVFVSILTQRKNISKVTMKQKILKPFEPEKIICFNFPPSFWKHFWFQKEIFYPLIKWIHLIWFMPFLLPVTGTLPCRYTLHCIIWYRMKIVCLK